MLSRLPTRKRADRPGEERSCPDQCGQGTLSVGTRALMVKRSQRDGQRTAERENVPKRKS